MECEYCYGHVKEVDSWGNYKTVECMSCGVRYDVKVEGGEKVTSREHSFDMSDISHENEEGKMMVEQALENAREILKKIDNRIDDLEGENVHSAILEIQDLLLQWNLIGHNFATNGIQDYVKSDNQEESDEIPL